MANSRWGRSTLRTLMGVQANWIALGNSLLPFKMKWILKRTLIAFCCWNGFMETEANFQTSKVMLNKHHPPFIMVCVRLRSKCCRLQKQSMVKQRHHHQNAFELCVVWHNSVAIVVSTTLLMGPRMFVALLLTASECLCNCKTKPMQTKKTQFEWNTSCRLFYSPQLPQCIRLVLFEGFNGFPRSDIERMLFVSFVLASSESSIMQVHSFKINGF